MKDKILEYIKLNPKTSYNDLVKIFGLPLEGIFKMLHIDKYNIEDNYIEIYNNNGYIIYIEYSSGDWIKYEYDINGNTIKDEYSNGEWYKYEYNTNGELIYSENSYGNKRNY